MKRLFFSLLLLVVPSKAYTQASLENELNQLSIAKATYAACVDNISQENERQYLSLESIYSGMAEHFFSDQGGKATFNAVRQIQFNSLRDAYLQGAFDINTEKCNNKLQSAVYKSRAYLEERILVQTPD